jgi:hypothetical protein
VLALRAEEIAAIASNCPEHSEVRTSVTFYMMYMIHPYQMISWAAAGLSMFTSHPHGRRTDW